MAHSYHPELEYVILWIVYHGNLLRCSLLFSARKLPAIGKTPHG